MVHQITVIIMHLNQGRAERIINKYLKEEGALHFTLIVPEENGEAVDVKAASKAARDAGTSAFIVRPKYGTSALVIEKTVKELKKHELPVLLLPTNVEDICHGIDAVLFITLLNSRNVYWMVGAQALGAPVLTQMGIETIPAAYLVFEPGGIMSWMGDVKPLPQSDPRLAAIHALGAEYFGMRYVYLETGLRRTEQVPTEIISAVVKMTGIGIMLECINAPVKYIKSAFDAGAKLIITEPRDDIKTIISAISTA